MENERKVSEASLIREINDCKQTARENVEKLISVEEIGHSHLRLGADFRKEINLIRGDVHCFKDVISADHSLFKMEFNERHQKFYHDLNKLSEQVKANTGRFLNHKDVLMKHDCLLETFK